MLADLHQVAAAGGVFAPFARMILAVVIEDPKTVRVLAGLDAFRLTGYQDFGE